MNFYNNFALFYDKWVSNDAQATAITQFYSTYIASLPKEVNVIYLAIATGRIALEIAKNNPHHITGIDQSDAMLKLCKKNFLKVQKEKQLSLHKQDILDLTLSSENNFFILPFRTLAHFITKEDKKRCLFSIYKAMQTEEIFIFDTDIFNEKKAREIHNQHQLGYYDQKSNEVIYNKFFYDFKKQSIEVNVYTALLNEDKLENLQTYSYQTSWISTKDLEIIIKEIGFKVKETIFSDSHQTWILQK